MDNESIKMITPFLWSYDVAQMNLERDKKRIITNILNLGTKQAVLWLFRVYGKSDIKKVLEESIPGEWSQKSLYFWSEIFGVKLKENVLRYSR